MKRYIECSYCGEENKLSLLSFNMFQFGCKHCHKQVNLENAGKAKVIYWVFFFLISACMLLLFRGSVDVDNIDKFWVSLGIIIVMMFTVVLPLNFILLKYILPSKINLKS